MSAFLVAAVQMNSQPDLESNLEEAYAGIAEAAGLGAGLVVLPEHFAFFGDEELRSRRIGQISAAVESALPAWASEFRVHLIGGSFPVRASEGRAFNRSLLVAPESGVVGSYDKIHLFDVTLSPDETYLESRLTEAGHNAPQAVEVEPLPKIALSICYDIRFPEVYRSDSTWGAAMISVPAAFTRPTGAAHWEVLLRARAIENGAYVVAAAQTGVHGAGRETYGHSMIVDPWGVVLADAGSEPGVVIAEIDPARVDEVRRRLPAHQHRVLWAS